MVFHSLVNFSSVIPVSSYGLCSFSYCLLCVGFINFVHLQVSKTDNTSAADGRHGTQGSPPLPTGQVGAMARRWPILWVRAHTC